MLSFALCCSEVLPCCASYIAQAISVFTTSISPTDRGGRLRSLEAQLELASRQPTGLVIRPRGHITQLLTAPTEQATKPKMQQTQQATRPGMLPTQQGTKHRVHTIRLLTPLTEQATKPRMLQAGQVMQPARQAEMQAVLQTMLQQGSSSRHIRQWTLPSPTLTRPSRWLVRLLQWHLTRLVSWLALPRHREATLSGRFYAWTICIVRL